jgi:pyrimidine operon attenuation protein/uracil phosphoribosyltransferase
METWPTGKRTCLYNATQLNTVLDSMAMQAAGILMGKQRVLIVGILRRGAPLADMLQHKLRENFKLDNLTRMNLQIKRYADDLKLIHPETQLTENPEYAALDLCGVTVVIVDDVMYRGHSLLRAIEYIAAKNADEIRTVVLVDRGVSKLPVRCDIAGVRLDIAPGDIIECNVPPYEDEFKIEVLQPNM